MDNLGAAAAEFLEAVGDNRLIAFYGNLGAGKTTFIKELCSRLGVEDNVCSPTFTIDSLREAEDLGLEEYFYSGCFCFMEWPEKVAELLPEEVVEVRIEPVDEVTRRILICM